MIIPAPAPDNYAQPAENEQEVRYLQARMIKEVVYCPRLFDWIHVEGQCAHNA
ncbi:MAG: hypothetical protein H8E66_33820 [Planctomycetes bacterium]|nr:hypothetical protein [Planctomycetota bacterium]